MNLIGGFLGAGAALSGYNASRQQAQDQALREAQAKSEIEGRAQQLYLQAQAEQNAQSRFERGLTASADENNAQRLFTKGENDETRKANQIQAKASFLASDLGNKDRLVGTPSGQQNAYGTARNSIAQMLGLPDDPVPFAPSGQFRSVVSANASPNAGSTLFAPPGDPSAVLRGGPFTGGPMDVGSLTTGTDREYPILNPGYGASPETAHTLAETAAIPLSAEMQRAKIIADMRQKAGEMGLKLMEIQHSDANAAANRDVALNGQKMGLQGTIFSSSAATGRQNDQQTFTADQTGIRTQNQQVNNLMTKRDAAAAKADEYRAMLAGGTSGKDAKGDPIALSPGERTRLSSMISSLSDTWKYYDQQIADVRKPENATVGNGTSAVKLSSGRTLLLTPRK